MNLGVNAAKAAKFVTTLVIGGMMVWAELDKDKRAKAEKAAQIAKEDARWEELLRRLPEVQARVDKAMGQA